VEGLGHRHGGSGFSRDNAFSANWLALREPADTRARSAAIVDFLLPQEESPPQEPLSIIDLGAGTGANLRYLAPRLGGRQEWLLVDSDGALLAVADTSLRDWAGTLDARVETEANVISITAASFSATVRIQELDVARKLATLLLPRGCLVTTSALLDLVSWTWLESLADACRAAHASVLFALTYDGRMTLEPAEPDDGLARALFNRHQHNDKGFGPALGPEAAAATKDAFANRGYTLETAASDWRLGRDEQRLQAELIDGWVTAALEVEPGSTRRLERWRARRRARIDAGEATLVVGHSDLAGLPS
jgi:SAM-dependent methyltransferase